MNLPFDKVEFNILVRDLAWPITVLLITFLFRAEFRRTLNRLSHLKYHDFEANFEKALREAEVLVKPPEPGTPPPAPATAAALELEAVATLGPHPQGHPKHVDSHRLLRIADVSPTAAIMEAWHDVETAAVAAGAALGIAGQAGESAASHAMHGLVDRGMLTSHTLVAFERLRRLHQQASRHPDLKFSSNQAHRYVELAHKIAARLYALGEHPGGPT